MANFVGDTSVALDQGLRVNISDVGSFRLAARDALFDLHGLLAVRHAERAAEDRHVLGQHRGAAGEVARQDVAGLERRSAAAW